MRIWVLVVIPQDMHFRSDVRRHSGTKATPNSLDSSRPDETSLATLLVRYGGYSPLRYFIERPGSYINWEKP